MFKHFKYVKLTIASLCVMSASCLTEAQTKILSDDNILQASEISALIAKESFLTSELTSLEQLQLGQYSPRIRLHHLRHHAHGIITFSNSLDAQKLLTEYSTLVENIGTHRDKRVFELYKSLLEDFKPNMQPKLNNADIDSLNNAAESKDWYIANTALLLKSVFNSFQKDKLNIALEQAQQAQRLIPDEISRYVTDAKIITLSNITTINNLMLDPELAIENTSKLIALKQEVGYPIDGSSLLNNLLYSLDKWRETEVSTQLAQAVLRIEEKAGSKMPGLTELRVARLYDRQNNFDASLKYSRLGLERVQIASLKESLQYVEINALFALGNLTEARLKLSRLQENSSGSMNKASPRNMVRAELGLAIATNDADKVYASFNTLLDLTAQSYLSEYNDNTSQMLASLQNTKERQTEREALLEQKAAMKQAEIDQQKQRNQLLMIIVSLLALAAFAAIIFARYRDKISKELAIKTLQAEDADRMKSEFLGMISHELRTPLNGIVGIADLLTMKAPTADLRHKAGIILDSSNKLTHVIESIVDMSRIDGEKMDLYPEPTDVHDIVTDLNQLWRPTLENKGVTFTVFVENSLADDVVLDKARFRQCLNNLLSNAVKFTESGRVHLHVTSAPVEKSDDVEITAIVADTGQGMSREVQGKLFTPFLQADSTMTRKHGGSGLGLAITQSLARMMGGDVTMVSNLNRGSEFTLTVRAERSEGSKLLDDIDALMALDIEPEVKPEPEVELEPEVGEIVIDTVQVEPPAAPALALTDIEIVAEPSVSQALPKPRPEAESLRGLKVLIVEDVEANHDVIKLFLAPEGCQTLSALTAMDAIDILDTQAIDIILMDIRMPQMDGIAATRAIRGSNREYKNTPIIALTADASAETNAACMAAGADIFLTKPVVARELVESIRFARRFQDADKSEPVRAA